MTTDHSVPDHIYKIINHLACPQCKDRLTWAKNILVCRTCDTSYPIINGIADLRPPANREKTEVIEWSKHWSYNHQQNLSQRFFSFYRKAVFARTVRYFVERYFHDNGIFVEAGSGTSETSAKIDGRKGGRMLVATDIVLPVLSMCASIMDVRICGDIFNLPFCAGSIAGIWNVGVMEHFRHDQIDRIMTEFYRVLKNGGRIILLWPGADSIPLKLLQITEDVVNLRKRDDRFRFHLIPDEISQLRSLKEGRNILTRNRFRPLHVANDFRSFKAFKILVGEKTST